MPVSVRENDPEPVKTHGLGNSDVKNSSSKGNFFQIQLCVTILFCVHIYTQHTQNPQGLDCVPLVTLTTGVSRNVITSLVQKVDHLATMSVFQGLLWPAYYSYIHFYNPTRVPAKSPIRNSLLVYSHTALNVPDLIWRAPYS